jgi:hypothetical protein
MKLKTDIARENKNRRQRENRARRRDAVKLAKGEEPNVPRKDTHAGVPDHNSYWVKQTLGLAASVSKACNKFFERRGEVYEYVGKR